MKIRQLVATATIVSVGAVTGLSQGVAGAYPYYGHATTHAYTKTNTMNTNSAAITNNNPQYAVSGTATATTAPTGPSFGWQHTATNSGKATSGAAQNTSSLNATVGMANTASTAAAPAPTAHVGTHSTQATTTNTNNVNQVTVTNNNAQVARSGNALTTGQSNSGDVTTGAAANASSTTVSVNLSNHADQ